MSSLPAHDMGPAANAFRKEVRDWLATQWTPEKRAEHLRKPFKDRGWDVEFSKLMGRDGAVPVVIDPSRSPVLGWTTLQCLGLRLSEGGDSLEVDRPYGPALLGVTNG